MDGTAGRPPGQAIAPPYLLCGRPAVLIGVFTSHDQPSRLLTYGLCRRHPVNRATIDAIDERIDSHLVAERN
jgi:hypothetical protein